MPSQKTWKLTSMRDRGQHQQLWKVWSDTCCTQADTVPLGTWQEHAAMHPPEKPLSDHLFTPEKLKWSFIPLVADSKINNTDITNKIFLPTIVLYKEIGTHTSCFAISSEKMERKRIRNIKVQPLQNLLFHPSYLFLCVCLVCHKGKVCNFWAVHLLILAGDQHCCHPHQLQLCAGYGSVQLRVHHELRVVHFPIFSPTHMLWHHTCSTICQAFKSLIWVTNTTSKSSVSHQCLPPLQLMSL